MEKNVMKLIFGFTVPLAIFTRIDNLYSIFKDGVIYYHIEGTENVLCGEELKDSGDEGCLKLTTDLNKEMSDFTEKDRISELNVMKAVEKILTKWLSAFKNLIEEYKEVHPDADTEEIDLATLPYSLPESLDFDWYVVKGN